MAGSRSPVCPGRDTASPWICEEDVSGVAVTAPAAAVAWVETDADGDFTAEQRDGHRARQRLGARRARRAASRQLPDAEPSRTIEPSSGYEKPVTSVVAPGGRRARPPATGGWPGRATRTAAAVAAVAGLPSRACAGHAATGDERSRATSDEDAGTAATTRLTTTRVAGRLAARAIRELGRRQRSGAPEQPAQRRARAARARSALLPRHPRSTRDRGRARLAHAQVPVAVLAPDADDARSARSPAATSPRRDAGRARGRPASGRTGFRHRRRTCRRAHRRARPERRSPGDDPGAHPAISQTPMRDQQRAKPIVSERPENALLQRRAAERPDRRRQPDQRRVAVPDVVPRTHRRQRRRAP